MKIAKIEATLIDHMGSDLSVVNAARVSFEKESVLKTLDGEKFFLSDSDTKLITYLATHKHFSPFNHAFMSFRVKAPLSVARQLVKHKFLPWNEVSRRYVDSEPEFYIPAIYRARGENVKQGSSDADSGYDRHAAIAHTQICLDEYNARLSHGVCPEQARDCLPVNTMTEWWWSGSLGAWLDMLVLRLDPHAQKESREVATLIAKEVEKLFPVSYQARINGPV